MRAILIDAGYETPATPYFVPDFDYVNETDNTMIAANAQNINFVNGVALSTYIFSSNAGVDLFLRLRLIND